MPHLNLKCENSNIFLMRLIEWFSGQPVFCAIEEITHDSLLFDLHCWSKTSYFLVLQWFMIATKIQDTKRQKISFFCQYPLQNLHKTCLLPVPTFFNDKSIDALRSIFIRLGDKNLSPKLLCKGTIRCASKRGLHKSQAA